MKVDESFVVAAPPALVWKLITDPDGMGQCIPGCERIEVKGPTTYLAIVSVKVGPVAARFNLEVEVTEQTPPIRLTSVTRGEEGSWASVLTSHNALTLTPVDATTTEVHYTSEVSITGRLGKFGLGVMKKMIRSHALAFADAFRKRVEAARMNEPG